jgi:hypothetical protein
VDDHDSSNEFAYCVRVDELAVVVKIAYYGARLFQILRSLPVPPPAV